MHIDLLMTCSSLTVLVTSLALLRVSGKHAYVVSLLAVTDAPDAIARPEAVRLFAHRAAVIELSFELTLITQKPSAR